MKKKKKTNLNDLYRVHKGHINHIILTTFRKDAFDEYVEFLDLVNSLFETIKPRITPFLRGKCYNFAKGAKITLGEWIPSGGVPCGNDGYVMWVRGKEAADLIIRYARVQKGLKYWLCPEMGAEASLVYDVPEHDFWQEDGGTHVPLLSDEIFHYDQGVHTFEKVALIK